MFRKLRCKSGVFRSLEIDGNGGVRWSGDGDYTPVTRVSGRKKKYKQVQLMRNGSPRWFYVHRLVAFSWLGPPPHLLRFIVDHIDKNSMNNAVENLRYVTPTANQINKKCKGITEQDGLFYPKIAGYIHRKYGCDDLGLCETLRSVLVESYVRYNCRFPNNGNAFPHSSIHLY
jgi:hypothetical protein